METSSLPHTSWSVFTIYWFRLISARIKGNWQTEKGSSLLASPLGVLYFDLPFIIVFVMDALRSRRFFVLPNSDMAYSQPTKLSLLLQCSMKRKFFVVSSFYFGYNVLFIDRLTQWTLFYVHFSYFYLRRSLVKNQTTGSNKIIFMILFDAHMLILPDMLFQYTACKSVYEIRFTNDWITPCHWHSFWCGNMTRISSMNC